MALAFVGETANPPTTLSGTSATTQTCTRTFTGGNAVIAFCMGIGSATTVTFTDDAGNTWTTDTTVTPLGGGFQCLATGHALNVSVGPGGTPGPTTVTATWNASVHHSFVILVEVSGAKTASALEGKGGQFQNPGGTGTDGLTSGNPSPAPTTTANTFVCGFTCNFNNNIAPTAVGTGFTQTGAVKYTASMGGVQGEYKIVSAAGTYPATFTCTTSDNWTTCVVILAEAPASTASIIPEAPGPPIRQANRPIVQREAQGLPAALKSPWAFVEPPRIAPPRKQEAAQASPLPASQQSPWAYVQPTQTPAIRRNPGEAANPLPAPPVVGALPFAAHGDSIRRAAPPPRAQIADALPPVTAPWVDSQPVRQAPRKPAPPQSADPLPPATRLGPIVEIQPARRFVRSIVNMIREAIGLPALLPPPPAELKLKPPLWAVFDEVSLTAETDAVALSATVDEVSLSVESDT